LVSEHPTKKLLLPVSYSSVSRRKYLGMQPNSIANTKKTKGALLANRTDKYGYNGYLKEKISNSIIIYWATTFHL